jgi:lysophospholipase L1-like esterase
MRITYPSLLFLALTVAACGGGSSGAATQGPTTNGTTQGGSSVQKSTGGLIEYYGDSTIWGWSTYSADSNTGDQVATPAPVAFARALPTTPKYEVTNEGASGSTACGLLRGEDGKHPAWDEQLDKRKDGKWVILNHGINDRKTYGADTSTYKDCLRQLVQKAKAKGREVILETPNPIVPYNLDDYAQAMRDVAKETGAPVIDQYKQLMDFLHGASASEICPDGLHPKDEIYIMKGEFAAKEFKRFYP